MASYLRLFPATQQFELRNGQLNVAGQLKVFYEGTDDLAGVYDADGTQLSQPVILDDNGRALGLFVDASRVYRLEVYDSFGELLYTVRKMVPSGGGSGSVLGKSYEVVSSDGTVKIQEFDNGGTITFDLSTDVEDTPSRFGVKNSMLSGLDGDGEWHSLADVSTTGTMPYLEGWVLDKDCTIDIAATVEIPASDPMALHNVDIMADVVVDGQSVFSDEGHLDPTVPLQKISFEWKGECHEGQTVDVILRAASTESLSCGFVGRAYINEECDGIVGGGGGSNYVAGQYIDIDQNNVISVTGVQPLSGMSAYAYESSLSSFVQNSAFSSYSAGVHTAITAMSSDITNLSSTVSGLTGQYLEQSASALFAPSSLETSKMDVSGMSAYQLSGDYLTATASALFQPSGNYLSSTDSALFQPSGNYLSATDSSNFILTSQSGAFAPSGNYVSSTDMSAYVPFSAVAGDNGQVTAIDGSAIRGHEYSGLGAVVVDNTADTISIRTTGLAVDGDTMSAWVSGDDVVIGVKVGVYAYESSNSAKLDTSAFSSVSGTFLTAVPTGYALESYVDSAVSGKLDSTASSQFITSTAGLATTADVESAVSGKLDSSASGEFYPMTGNPSGFLTAHQSLAGLATETYVDSAVSGKLDLSAYDSAQFYLTSNPSGFITGVDLSPYQLTADMSAYIPVSALGTGEI